MKSRLVVSYVYVLAWSSHVLSMYCICICLSVCVVCVALSGVFVCMRIYLCLCVPFVVFLVVYVYALCGFYMDIRVCVGR